MYIRLHPALSFHQLGRRNNQEDARYPDSDSPSPLCRTFVVCDGVGGLDKGEIASSTVASTMGASMEDFADPHDEFTTADFAVVLADAYRALSFQNTGANTGMATTLTFVHFHAGGVFTAYIGDSRIYHIRPGAGIIYRSFDHSLVNALVRAGNISPAEAIDHPQSNVITRCMGGADPVHFEPAQTYNISDVQADDYFLLCSDGVLHQLDDNALCELLQSNCSDLEIMETLAAISADSTDNNTAILIHVESVSDTGNADTDLDDAPNLDYGTPTTLLNPRPAVAADVAPGYPDDDAYYNDDDEDPDFADDPDDDDGGPGDSGNPVGNFFRRLFT